jgi:hypothetical protein
MAETPHMAHIKKISGDNFLVHLLEEHLSGTSALTERFASEFDNAAWGKLIGLWHDVGNYPVIFSEKQVEWEEALFV